MLTQRLHLLTKWHNILQWYNIRFLIMETLASVLAGAPSQMAHPTVPVIWDNVRFLKWV